MHTIKHPKEAKYELHISDVRTFKSCRRRWDWSSPLRRHLEPLITPPYFLVGKAVHYALATFYEAGEVPAEVFERYMRAEIDKYETELGPVWNIERQPLEDLITLGTGMLENYLLWRNSADAPDERWRIVATEMPFSVPILTSMGKPSSRIFLNGRLDGIVRDVETGLLWVREYKTSSREPNRKWLDLDDQATIYCWAAQQIIQEPIAGIQYRFLMKKIPEMPRILNNGTLSRAINSTLATTYEVYLNAIRDLTIDKINAVDLTNHLVIGETQQLITTNRYVEEFNRQVAEYREVLDELALRGYTQFFKEFEVERTQAELNNAAQELWTVGLEMVRSTTKVYTSADWLKCSFCSFQAPCKVANNNGNFEQLLKHEYRHRQTEDPVESQDKVNWQGQGQS